ncbi:MAG: cupin domain-containing protein [Candidatus Binatia bacterium]
MKKPVRRVVTGHDAEGNAMVAMDSAAPVTYSVPNRPPGYRVTQIWMTDASPIPIDNAGDPTSRPLKIEPNANGSVIRVIDFPPETDFIKTVDVAAANSSFAAYGSAKASTVRKDSPHPFMHRTETVDYGIVLEGEIYMVLDKSEVLLKAGDIVVQRGTNHAWSNRSNSICTMVFVLMDGKFDADLRRAFSASEV